MVMLGKAQQIYDLKDVEFVDVEVPEWVIDGEPITVRLKCLTGFERDRYEQSLQKTVKGRNGQREIVPDLANARARLVAWSAIDEDGQPVFVGDEAVLRLGTRNAKALDRLWQAACKLSGIDMFGPNAEDERAEDFNSGPNASSTSG